MLSCVVGGNAVRGGGRGGGCNSAVLCRCYQCRIFSVRESVPSKFWSTCTEVEGEQIKVTINMDNELNGIGNSVEPDVHMHVSLN